MLAREQNLHALGILGATWRLADRTADPDPALRRQLGQWFPEHDPDHAFPDGLTRDEALGLTLASRWFDGGVVRVSRVHGVDGWTVQAPGFAVHLGAAQALPITEALLRMRRVLWPRPAWLLPPRDMVAEHLQQHARAMAAALRPAPLVQVLTPAVNLSDVGRNWSGGYDARG